MAGYSLIVVRAATGKVRAMQNVCRHCGAGVRAGERQHQAVLLPLSRLDVQPGWLDARLDLQQLCSEAPFGNASCAAGF